MTYGIILAAGQGLRMGLNQNKVLAAVKGQTVIARSITAFNQMVEGLVLVIRKEDELEIKKILETTGLTKEVKQIVFGGETRQDSVFNGLKALPKEVDKVLIHDGARPFLSKKLIARVIEGLGKYQGVVPVIAVADTIKEINDLGEVVKTLPRNRLRAVQTPQGFDKLTLLRAYEEAEKQGFTGTDDASLLELIGVKVGTVKGEEENLKLTTKVDLNVAKALYQKAKEKITQPIMPSIRVGQGYDVHQLVEGRPLIICGVTIPYDKGLLGHSDADVGTHALIDSLLGAAGLGDIGSHFPDQSAQYKDISSILLLEKVAALLSEKGYGIQNVDVTLVAQAPKLKPYIEEMKKILADTLQISAEQVNVKATTTENLGFEGEGKGISAQAVALIYKP